LIVGVGVSPPTVDALVRRGPRTLKGVDTARRQTTDTLTDDVDALK
jgi:hypothetical protein